MVSISDARDGLRPGSLKSRPPTPCTSCSDSMFSKAFVPVVASFHCMWSVHITTWVCISARSKANALSWHTSYLLIVVQLDSAFNFSFELGEVSIPLFQQGHCQAPIICHPDLDRGQTACLVIACCIELKDMPRPGALTSTTAKDHAWLLGQYYI